MKKRKYLLLTFLALAIVTSLTAGTLAIYTSSKDIGDASANVQAKKYVFTAEKSTGYQESIKIAPTESQAYPFEVANFEGTSASEVPLDYTITATTANLFTTFPGLKVELFRDGTAEAIKAITTGDLSFTDGTMHFNAPTTLVPDNKATHKYRVVLTWISDGTTSQNTTQTAKGVGAVSTSFRITVTATQDTTPQTNPFTPNP